MSYLGLLNRFQIQMRRLVEFIDNENAVRFAELFLQQLNGLKYKAILTGAF